MTNSSIYRRRPILSSLIILLALLIIILVTALLQLDIGSYQQQLVNRLSQTLKKPVTLGDVKFSFHGGIALDFSNVRIGADDNFSLLIPQLSMILKPIELLQGEIVIEQVILDTPVLKFKLPLPLAKSNINLDQLGLKTLQIRKGSLTVLPSESDKKPLQIRDFNLVVHGLGKGLVSELAITATIIQIDQNAQLNLHLELTRQHLGQPWRQGTLLGNISLNNLNQALTSAQNSAELPEQFNLKVDLLGVPAEKVLIKTSVIDSKNNEPFFKLSSDWQSSPMIDRFNHLSLGEEQIPLSGGLQLSREDVEPQLTGHIEVNNAAIKSLLPRVKTFAKLTGEVEKLALDFQGPLHTTEENPLAPLQSVDLKIRDLTYPIGTVLASKVEMEIELLKGRLSLKNGQGLFAKTPFTFTAASGPINQSPLEIVLALNSSADLQQLQTDYAASFPERNSLKGEATLDLIVQGPMDQLSSKFKIDLTKTELIIGKILEKKENIPLTLEVNGRLEPNFLAAESATIKIDQTSIDLTGHVTHKNNLWSGDIKSSPFQLESLQPVSPIFAFFKIVGETEGQLTFGGENGPEGQIDLSNGGAHLTQLIGDLSQVNTTLNLDKEGFDLGRVKARLGQSAINVSGGLKNWRSPLLSLRVDAEELHAQDLIFTNPQMMLQNIKGQLLISAGGITFDQIQVTVENKTTATVDGQMRGYREPQTFLDISSEDADILHIIQLFTGPNRFAESAVNENNATLEIRTRATKGSLGSFLFENAEATIKDHNKVFTVFPLNIKLGNGTASGRVEIDRLRNNLLKISGQAINCDADSVYEMLFEKKGIFRGTLNGNFYIEGEEIGEQFWKTSHGGGHLHITDGAMRQLEGFAKIFSLLNVSQLFTFNLPDMDEEGLPLSLLKTSARISEGIVHFDDFNITSPAINISAVGKIDSLHQTIDSTVGIKPLRTVDIILSRVPLFGWVLTGDEEALITAIFTLKGPVTDPVVSAAPVSSVAKTALGIIGRAFGLPFRMLQKTGEFLTTPPRPPEEDAPIEEEKN